MLKIDCATGENERLMRKDMIADMAEMLEQCGVKDVNTYDNEYFPGMGIHEMGTARMGRDPEDVGAQHVQPGVGRAERVRHRRLVHGVGRVLRTRRSPTWRSRRARRTSP